MRPSLRVVLTLAIALGVLAGTGGAVPNPDANQHMNLLFTSPNGAINSDLAFWGNHAFVGYYTGDAAPRGGVRIFDISDPGKPKLVKDLQCDANQNDPIVWDRNGNGIADLLLVGVDRTMANPNCGAPRAAHDDPNGWEGIRVFTMSDNPANPFATITQVASVYQDCGSHTITAWPGLVATQNKLIVYSASYPLRPGPTCGQLRYNNTTNPYDSDPGVPGNPLHGVIQAIEVPLGNPAASQKIANLPISYPGDPDGKIDWCERNLCAPGVLEPAAVACHDIVVHVDHHLAGGACAEQGQVWRVNPATGLPDTANPLAVMDDKVTSGGTGNIPGAVDFFHSVMFNNAGTVVNLVDESFGTGCPTMTTYQPRPWNPAGGTHKTGRMFFSDLDSGKFLSEFHVGDKRPDPTAGSYCSAHMGMAIMDIKQDLLVNAWYTGGTNVIDFTKPDRPKEIAYYDIAGGAAAGSDNWSAYPYFGPAWVKGYPKGGAGIPVYASDGVNNPALGRGFVVFQALVKHPGSTRTHLNPQTMD